MSSLVMCFGMSSSRRASMASSQPSAGTVSSISRRTLKETFSLMPYWAGSKSTNCAMSTMPLEKTTTLRSLTSITARLTPRREISCAFSRVTVSPFMAMISPVIGSVTGSASTWPLRRLQMSSFLLNL